MENLSKKIKTIEAEADMREEQQDYFIGDLVGECPKCKAIDAFVSTGQHKIHGNEIVVCSQCGETFNIVW